MQAPQAPNVPDPDKYSHLLAIAKLGRSDDIKPGEGSIAKGQYGYTVSRTTPGNKNYVNVDAVKDAIQLMPGLFREGAIDEKFYKEVRSGIEKLQYKYSVEKDAIETITELVFHQNIKPTSLVNSDVQRTKTQLKSFTSSGSERLQLNTDEIFPEIQQKAIDELSQLVSPLAKKEILAQLKNLEMISTPDDLKTFTEYISALVKLKNETIIQFQTNSYVLNVDAIRDITDKGMAVVEQSIFTKYKNPEDSQLMGRVLTLIDQVTHQNFNTQSLQDIYYQSFDETDRHVTRRENTTKGEKEKLRLQEEREKNNQPREFGDYTPDEKALIKQGFTARNAGFNMWLSSGWENLKVIPTEPYKHIFISGTMTLSYAVAGQKPATGKVDLDLSQLGSLNQDQSHAVMRFLGSYIFDMKPPEVPESLNFLKEMKPVNISILDTLKRKNSMDMLLELADQKRKEVNDMMALVHFKANHPDVKI